jgi:hypothetical protein
MPPLPIYSISGSFHAPGPANRLNPTCFYNIEINEVQESRMSSVVRQELEMF